MKVQMWVPISGGRGDGSPWPAPGGILEVSEEEGRHLCAARLAGPVADEASGAGDSASAPAPAPEPSAPPRVNAPRSDWETHAVASGASQDDVAGMTKAELVSTFGKGAA